MFETLPPPSENGTAFVYVPIAFRLFFWTVLHLLVFFLRYIDTYIISKPAGGPGDSCAERYTCKLQLEPKSSQTE